MLQTLCEGMFVTVSLLRCVCYRFSVEVFPYRLSVDVFVTGSLWRYVCFRLSVEEHVVCNRLSVEVCLLQILYGGMFVTVSVIKTKSNFTKDIYILF